MAYHPGKMSDHSASQKDQPSPARELDEEHIDSTGGLFDAKKGGYRSLLMGVLFLALFAAAVVAMRWVGRSATLDVTADKRAAALLNAGAVSMERASDGFRVPLRTGKQTIKAGQYAIEVSDEGADLQFSTGRQFEIQAANTLRMTITGD